jgi:enoyl-CoA hydratase
MNETNRHEGTQVNQSGNDGAVSHVRVEVDGNLATVTIDRPDKLNALNAGIIAELGAAVSRLAADDSIRGVLLTGAGPKAFVAGADIAELARMGPISGVRVSRDGQEVFRAIERMPKPVVAAVNGFALGGGCELALACHLRVASTKAQFGLPEVKLGIIPGYGGTVRLARLVGRGRALEMILTGDMIDAQEAYRIGLVNRVVEPGALLEASRALLGRIAGNGPIAVRLAIEAVDRAAATTTEDALVLESNSFGLLAATSDRREGMEAFLEKRRPNFAGR